MSRRFLFCLCLLSCTGILFGEVRGAYQHYFSLEGDYVLMRRANSNNKNLAEAAGGPEQLPPSFVTPECAKEAGKPLVNTRDLVHDMHFDSGYSAALKVFQSLNSTWELRYLGGLAWQGQQTKSCLQNLNLDGNLAFQTIDYNFADRVKAQYLSDMWTAELNYWHHITPRYTDHFSVSWLAGLRYFNIHEKLKMYFTKERPTYYHTSHYRVKAADESFGLQIGADLEYNPYHFLTWGVVVKVGGLFNRNKQKTWMGDINDTIVIRDIDKSSSNFAYCAQVYPFIELRPTKHFFFMINYQMLYIGGIATASNNLVFHGSGAILDHNGHIIYHGLTAGMQFNF